MNIIGLKTLVNISLKLNRILILRNFSHREISNNVFQSLILNNETRSVNGMLFYNNTMKSTSKMYHNQNIKEKNPLTLTNAPIISSFPTITLSLFSRIKMWFVMKLIDSKFNSNEFMNGCEQAVILVSNNISKEKFNNLDGLVYSEIIEEIKTNIKKLTPEQKSLVAVNKGDIQKARLFDFEFRKANNKIFIRVSVRYIYTPKLRETLEKIMNHKGTDLNSTFFEIGSRLTNIMSANYKFVKEYSTDKKDNAWTISELNHWKPDDIFFYKKQ